MVDRDQIFTVNKEERIIEFSLPVNLTDSVFCLTIEQMDIQKDLIAEWKPLKKCIKKDIKKIRIDNPYDRFRVKICLVNIPDVCSGSINQRPGLWNVSKTIQLRISPTLDATGADTLVSTKLIGTVAAICTALVIVLAILLFFILIRSRKFLPVISDLKVMKRNRKSSYSKFYFCPLNRNVISLFISSLEMMPQILMWNHPRLCVLKRSPSWKSLGDIPWWIRIRAIKSILMVILLRFWMFVSPTTFIWRVFTQL